MTDTSVSGQRSSKLLWVGGSIFLLLVIVFATRLLLAHQRQRAEVAAKSRFSELGALASMDANGKFVQTLAIRKNLPEALTVVNQLSGLTHLDLADTDFTDEQLVELVRPQSINSLVLSHTRITDAGVAVLESWSIESLFLAGTSITPSSLDSVARIKTLKVLDLSQASVADNLQALAGHPNLEWIVLDGMDLSSLNTAAVDALAGLPKLGRLTALNTGLTDEAVERMKSVKPGLNIETSPATSPIPVTDQPAGSQ